VADVVVAHEVDIPEVVAAPVDSAEECLAREVAIRVRPVMEATLVSLAMAVTPALSETAE